MTKDEFMAFAVESGMALLLEEHAGEYGNGTFENTPYPELETFAKLVADAAAAVEREACAKACETEADNPSCLWEEPGCWQHAAENCAGSIRARGNT